MTFYPLLSNLKQAQEIPLLPPKDGLHPPLGVKHCDKSCAVALIVGTLKRSGLALHLDKN